MQNNNYLIRNMSSEEANIAVKWASKEGWNPGIYDLNAFYKTDNTGWWIGLLNDKPIAVITAIKYKNEFSFVGFYIVKSEYRGKGYGIKLWNRALESLNGILCGLDGVVDQQENYKKSGFIYAHRNVRYKTTGLINVNLNPNITDINDIPFNNLLIYDSECFPASRPQFLSEWIKLPESFTLAFTENNTLKGYGTIRKCREGFKIGPLFADNETVAEELLISLLSKVNETDNVYFDIPETNLEAVKIVNKYNMQYVFETARMYKNGTPKINMNKVFGITTFELG